jgi:hypothetical protein
MALKSEELTHQNMNQRLILMITNLITNLLIWISHLISQNNQYVNLLICKTQDQHLSIYLLKIHPF